MALVARTPLGGVGIFIYYIVALVAETPFGRCGYIYLLYSGFDSRDPFGRVGRFIYYIVALVARTPLGYFTYIVALVAGHLWQVWVYFIYSGFGSRTPLAGVGIYYI